MRTPSEISSSSSSSGSLRSGTTTPASEFSSSKLFLLPPTYLDSNLLKSFALELGQGSGDKVILLVDHDSSNGNVKKTLVQRALEELAEVIPDARILDRRWTKVSKGGTFYLVDNPFSEEASVDDFINCHVGKVAPIVLANALNVFSSSGLRLIYAISSPNDALTLYCLERPAVTFPPLRRGVDSYSPFGVPTVDEWQNLWAAWDLVTLEMIPQEMLHQKPIDLRHKCLFYIGHIPTFLDMLMSKALTEPNTEPKSFTLIFERGIDPHVDDPDYCHHHSEVPGKDEDWPTLGSILGFRDRVRARLLKLYEDYETGTRIMNRHVARMLAMTHEHEGWHVETLLYMLIQRAGSGTLPPRGFSVPPWQALAKQWDATKPPTTPAVTLDPTTVMLGHDDCEGDDLTPGISNIIEGHEFGWDNESPVRAVEVKQIKMEWRPITNAEYLAFYEDHTEVGLPASWVESEEEIKVRTLYGPVPMAVAQHWPVLASYDSLLAYAKFKGGRLPTEPELRLFLDMYEVGYSGGANTGFRNWHPVPATTGLQEHGGRGSNGGVWEWTSTLFSNHAGFFPTKHFPGYSEDFFDGKHHVVLGSSYATIPRIAGRRTVRNFYQHNYPYPWVGARVVYDL